MGDIRLAGEWLPMSSSESVENAAAVFHTRSQNVRLGCESEACGPLASAVCQHGLLCVDLWRHAECRCD